jgi:hypothetical protein
MEAIGGWRVLQEGDSETKYVSVFDRVADPSVPKKNEFRKNTKAAHTKAAICTQPKRGG